MAIRRRSSRVARVRPYRSLGNWGFCVASFFLPAAILIESAIGESVELNEVIVTAQKRPQRAQDVGVSLTVLDGRKITDLAWRDTTSIVEQTPGLQVQQYSESITEFNIRGVSQNDFSDHLEGPIAVYTDDSYQATLGETGTGIFDLERVEIARGPQGTLFGRNATGGLIHFVTRKPTENPQGYLQLTAGEFGETTVRGAFSGPLASGIAGRLAIVRDRGYGYIKDLSGGTGPHHDSIAGRGHLAIDLGAATHILLTLRTANNRNEQGLPYQNAAAAPNADGLGRFIAPNENFWNTCSGCDLAGYRFPLPNRRRNAFDHHSFFDRSVRSATARIETPFGGSSLVSVSDWMKMDKTWSEDSDGSPNATFNFSSDQRYHRFAQELRLEEDTSTRHWDAGLYYLEVEQHNSVSVQVPPYSIDYLTTWRNTTRSGAIFGQFEQNLATDWSGILGARYSRDEKEQDFRQFDESSGESLLIFNRTTFPDLTRKIYGGLSGKAELDYRPLSSLLLYGSVNRGYKGGNWATPAFPVTNPSAPSASDLGQLVHRAERLTSLETGAKWSSEDHKIRIDGSIFHYDYRDYQAFFYVGVTQAIGNRNAAVDGLEFELEARPANGWTTEFGVATLDAVVHGVTLPTGRKADRRMPLAPKLSATALLRYDWTTVGGQAAVTCDAKYDSPQFFTALNSPDEREPGRITTNLTLGWTAASGRVSTELFVRNLTDRLYRRYALDISSVGFVQQVFAPPRTAGLSISFKYE